MSKRRVAILGASGLVGQRFCQLLSGHPLFEEPDLYSWQRSDQKMLVDVLKVPSNTISGELLEKRMNIMETGALKAEKYDAIFSAIPDIPGKNLEMELSEAGNRIFTNSSTNRMNDGVPIVVPEINSDHMEMLRDRDGFIVANGNCSTIGLAIPLKPLLQFSPAHIEVTTMQALSGSGYPGVPSMDAVSNLVPFIGREEEKIMQELPKVFGSIHGGKVAPAQMDLGITCTRVPVRDGHTEAVSIRFEGDIQEEDIEGKLSGFCSYPQEHNLPTAPVRPIIVEKSEDRPQPQLDAWNGSPERARGMAVTVGRIRKQGSFLRFVTLSNNTVRGAAGGSVLNSEIAIGEGLI